MRKHKPLSQLRSTSKDALEKMRRYSLYKCETTKNKEKKKFFSREKENEDL